MKYLLLCTMLVCSLAYSQQTKKISGKIVDKEGSPLPGASVVEKANGSNGVSVDFDGEFTIAVDENSKTLTVSFIGYKSEDVEITGDYLTVTLEEDASQLNEVVVKGFETVASKARVRKEAIQSLPETTVALNAKSIKANGIVNVQTFTSQISNVTFNQAQQPGVNFLTVRGISQIRNGSSPVAIVIDGMTLPDASIMNMSLYDLEFIEFIKGPQGTLYGKNAIAGAINIVTKDPTNKNKTKLKFSAGNGGLYGGSGSSSGAIVKDKFYYSVSGIVKKFKGLINNTLLNETVDFSQEYTVRAKLKYKFNQRWAATFVQNNFNIDAGGNYYVTKTDIFNPKIPVLADNDYSHEPFGDILGDSELSNSLSSLKVEGSLERVRFQSVTSFNATKRYYIGENDYSQYAFSKVSQKRNSDTFSQEFRLTSKDNKDSKLNYTFGTLFQNSKRYLNTSTFLNTTFYTGFTDASVANAKYSNTPIVGNDDDNTIRTLAGFMFFDYKLTSKFTLSGGVRVDNDFLKNESRISNNTKENSITVWQPKFSIAYKFTEDIMAYANYGRGYRSGGFNSKATVKFDKAYKPEFTNNYELGLKTSFLNKRIIFNNSLYRIDFENQQQYTFIPTSPSVLGIYNLDQTKITGVESEIKFKATNSLDFFASLGFNDGEIVKGTYNRLTNAAAFDYDTHEVVDVSGNKSPFTVKSTLQFGVNTNFKLNEKAKLSVHLNSDTRGTQYWDPLEQYKQEPYTLINGRIIMNYSKVEVTLWANNILNTKYNTEFFPTAEFGFNNLRFPSTPTSFGIDLAYTF